MSNTAIIICHIISDKTAGEWIVNWTDMHTCISLYKERQIGVLLKLGKKERKQPNNKEKTKNRSKKEKKRLYNCHFLKIVSGDLSSL